MYKYELIEFPVADVRHQAVQHMEEHMRRNTLPAIVCGKSYLSSLQCDRIVEFMLRQEEYKFSHCNALTREALRPLDDLFNPIVQFISGINSLYWDYDIDIPAAAWMQTYNKGDSYQMHMDGSPGQNRKLSCVVMLSDEEDYSGGALEIHYHPQKFVVPKRIGTIVIFQSWMLHEVKEITKGTRYSLNVGIWGPLFK